MANGSFWTNWGAWTASTASFAGWYSIPIGLLGGVIGGAIDQGKANEEASARRASAENDIERMNNDLNDLLETKNDTVLGLNTDKYTVMTGRDTDAMNAAVMNPMQNKQAYEEINNTRIQAEQAVGQASQAVASSGFRNTGSGASLMAMVESQSRNAVINAKDRAMMVMASSYLQVSRNYFDATARMDAYQARIDSAELKYRQDKARIDREIDYKKKEAWDAAGYNNELTDEDFAEMNAMVADGRMTQEERDSFKNLTNFEKFFG